MKARLTVPLLSALVLAGGSPVFAAPPTTNCLDYLNGHRYACLLKISGIPVPTAIPVELSFNGGALETGGATPVPCSCGTGGTFNAPKFNASQAKWTCVVLAPVDDGATPFGFAIQGMVGKAGKLSKVTAADNQGGSYVLDCDLNDASGVSAR